jgi:hypothetical protein
LRFPDRRDRMERTDNFTASTPPGHSRHPMTPLQE